MSKYIRYKAAAYLIENWRIKKFEEISKVSIKTWHITSLWLEKEAGRGKMLVKAQNIRDMSNLI